MTKEKATITVDISASEVAKASGKAAKASAVYAKKQYNNTNKKLNRVI